MSELPPQHQNPNTIDANQQLNPATQVEFGQPTDMAGELNAAQTPDMSAGLAPETDPVTGAIDVQEGPIAANGIEVAAETTGRHHRSDDQESAADVAVQTELTRLQHAKQNMINIFGQDAYQERFANNPNVDPDAFVSKLQNEAPAGRHAAGEDDPQEFLNTWGVSQEAYDAMSRDEQVKVLKGEYAQAGGEATEPAASAEATIEEPVEAAREAVKQSLSDLAKEGVKLRWSEDEQPAPKQAQPKQDSPLTRAAKMGKLRAGWTDEEPDARNAFLNRQRRRSRPFSVSQRTKGPRMRTQEEIDALTAPLNTTENQPLSSVVEATEPLEAQTTVPSAETAANQSNESAAATLPEPENVGENNAPVFETQSDLFTHGGASAENLSGSDEEEMSEEEKQAWEWLSRDHSDDPAQQSWDNLMTMLGGNPDWAAPETAESNVVDIAHRRGFGRAALRAFISRRRGDRAA